MGTQTTCLFPYHFKDDKYYIKKEKKKEEESTTVLVLFSVRATGRWETDGRVQLDLPKHLVHLVAAK